MFQIMFQDILLDMNEAIPLWVNVGWKNTIWKLVIWGQHCISLQQMSVQCFREILENKVLDQSN